METPETMPDWLSSMPDGLKENETLAQFPTIGEAGQKLVDMMAVQDRSILIPGEDASDEDRNSYFTRLGRPEQAEGYELTKPDGLPEGLPYDEALEQKFHRTQRKDKSY